VYVVIHGGGYTLGRGDDFMAGAPIAWTNRSLIFVTVQYRLGAFGFLNSADVRKDGTANAGLLDQRLALNFIKTHIAKFGGDPDRVTIGGSSAGGGSVTFQLLLHGGHEKNPPFQAAIAGVLYCLGGNVC